MLQKRPRAVAATLVIGMMLVQGCGTEPARGVLGPAHSGSGDAGDGVAPIDNDAGPPVADPDVRSIDTGGLDAMPGGDLDPQLPPIPEPWACETDADCETGACSRGVCTPEGFVYIPPGTYWKGTPRSIQPSFIPELNVHPVSVAHGLWVAESEVTQQQFLETIRLAPWYFQRCGETCPVDRINFFDALHFANLRSAAEGLSPCYATEGCVGSPLTGCPPERPYCEEAYRCETVEFIDRCDGYRLLTDDEFEHVMRDAWTGQFVGGGWSADREFVRQYCGTGESPTYRPPVEFCRLAGAEEVFECGPEPVATRLPAPNGLWGLCGNLWEWVVTPHFSGTAQGFLPRPATEPEFRPDFMRVRSCSFSTDLPLEESRLGLAGDVAVANRGANVGFRLARTAPVRVTWACDGALVPNTRCVRLTDEAVPWDAIDDACARIGGAPVVDVREELLEWLAGWLEVTAAAPEVWLGVRSEAQQLVTADGTVIEPGPALASALRPNADGCGSVEASRAVNSLRATACDRPLRALCTVPLQVRAAEPEAP